MSSPSIRFKEFSSAWTDTVAKNVASSIVPGRNKPQNFDGKIPWITLPDIHGKFYIEDSLGGLCLSNEEIKRIGAKIVPKGTVIMSCVGELGVVAVAKNEVVINQQLHAFVAGNDVLNTFLKYAIEKSRPYLYTRATKTSVLYLNKENCEALPLILPKTDEQKKIADFLSAVDTKISLLKEKHTLLEQYKKGVMQKLFKQEIRFKDDGGSEFPDWQELPLSELSLKVSSKNTDESVTQVLTNSAKDGIVYQGDYFNKDIANQGNLGGYTIVEKNDFVYNPRISELAPVGPIKRNHKEQGVMSPLYTVFRFKDKSLLDFVEQYFNTTMWHRYMHSIANFGARHDRMNITTFDFYALPVPIPCQKEREKIVAFIEALNNKCDAVKSQLELTQTFKKGLLQQMFV